MKVIRKVSYLQNVKSKKLGIVSIGGKILRDLVGL
jgi:hypothetical protein